MTPANATSCKEMLAEVKLLISNEPRSEQLEMLYKLQGEIYGLIYDLSQNEPDPAELAHDRELSAADDRRDIEKGKQP